MGGGIPDDLPSMQSVYTQRPAGFYGALPTQAHHLLWDCHGVWIPGEQARSPPYIPKSGNRELSPHPSLSKYQHNQ